MNLDTTGTLVKFAAETSFDDLPSEVVQETKRIILDIIGCALGGRDLDKGKIAVEFARKLGGTPEATILATSCKVSSTNAAFADGELMHSLDFCSVLPPAHVAPFVTAAPLVLAELKESSGRDLILAVALAHEVSSRVGLSVGTMRAKAGGFPTRSYGLASNTFGAAVGAGRILGLDRARLADAFGISGYYAPLPSHTKFLYTPANGMAKYGPAGWTAQAGVTAALLAESGYRGDTSVLDGDFGFWAMNGSESCSWEKITAGLGKDWVMLNTTFKRWPCCGLFGANLDAFSELMMEYAIKPEDIDSVLIKGEGYAALPRFQSLEINTHLDAQMSLPYNVAVAAYGIPVGPKWQARSTIADLRIKKLMKKVSFEANPKCEEARYLDLEVEKRPYISRRPGYAEVKAKGKTYKKEVEYAKWLSMGNPDFRATDEGLAEKFMANSADILTKQNARKAVDAMFSLEKLDKVPKLIKLLCPEAK